nr:beta,beta-carotene 15,15'-dioxygenase [Quercus suber]
MEFHGARFATDILRDMILLLVRIYVNHSRAITCLRILSVPRMFISRSYRWPAFIHEKAAARDVQVGAYPKVTASSVPWKCMLLYIGNPFSPDSNTDTNIRSQEGFHDTPAIAFTRDYAFAKLSRCSASFPQSCGPLRVEAILRQAMSERSYLRGMTRLRSSRGYFTSSIAGGFLCNGNTPGAPTSGVPPFGVSLLDYTCRMSWKSATWSWSRATSDSERGLHSAKAILPIAKLTDHTGLLRWRGGECDTKSRDVEAIGLCLLRRRALLEVAIAKCPRSKIAEGEGKTLKSETERETEQKQELKYHDYSKTWPNDLGFDVVREERLPITLQLQGLIPNYAAGVVYRNGPGAYRVRNANGDVSYSCSHWFDGFAQLHKFELIRGDHSVQKIRYSSRFNVDSLMEELSRTGRYDGYTFAQKRDPCMSMFRKVMCLFTPTPVQTPSNCNVPVTISRNAVGFPNANIIDGHQHARPLVARTDEGHMKAIDPETLEPIGIAHQKCLHPLLKGPLSCAHAKYDDEGNVYNFNLDIGVAAVYRIFKTIAATGKTEILASISAPDIAPAYLHSFFMSDDHIVLCIWSAHLMAGGARVLWEKNLLDAIAPFDQSRSSKWFVVDRRLGRGVLAMFEGPAAFSFHTVNCFTVPGQQKDTVDLMCDTIQYANLDVLHKFYYSNMRSSSPQAWKWMHEKHEACKQQFVRYRLSAVPAAHTLPVVNKKQRENKSPLPKAYQQLLQERMIPAPIAGELPIIHPGRSKKPYRYFWNCTSDSSKSTFMDGLCKVDLETGEGLRWKNPMGHSPGEAIFVPNPVGTDEDDGVLLTIVLDGFNQQSYLLCLNAATMEEMGKAGCQGAIPFTVHGQHIPAVP